MAKAKARMAKVARVRASGPRASEELRQDGMGGRPPRLHIFLRSYTLGPP